MFRRHHGPVAPRADMEERARIAEEERRNREQTAAEQKKQQKIILGQGAAPRPKLSFGLPPGKGR
jgi:hypothetical protein